MNDQKVVMVLAWYSEDEWNKLKSVVDDPNTLDETYLEWRKQANETIAMLKNEGCEVRKVSIKIDELLEWCDEREFKPDGKARSEFATFAAQQRHK